MEDLSPDYEVGYGKPPKEHQFIRGQSGNPRGRPRGSKNKGPSLTNALNPFNEVLREAFEKPYTFVSNGKKDQKPALQFVVEKLMAEAARGDFRRQKLVVELAKGWSAQIQTEKSDRIGLNETYKEYWGPIFQAAEKRGSPEPLQLPHPAHLHFLPEEFDADLRGPLNMLDKAAWDDLKSQLRAIDDAIRYARAQLGTPQETPELRRAISQLQQSLRRTEAGVPGGWDWREHITDVDRAYYRQSS